MECREAGMSREGGDRNHSHRTTVEQLMKCYSSNKLCKVRKTDAKRVTERAHIHSAPVTIHCSSISRHAEPRLRPRTCLACRSYVTQTQKNFTPSVTAIPSLLPLDQLNHLPYQPIKTIKNRQKARHKYREPEKVSSPRNLISCTFRVDGHVQATTSLSSCSSGSQSLQSGSSDTNNHRFPAFPSRKHPENLFRRTNPIAVPQSTPLADTELRKWIIQFGGDEQAAYMAKGLQKLHIAYERGKAEMSRQTENETLKLKRLESQDVRHGVV
ncbi:uncharacterized protein O3C94_007345 [Discoglossus pictus]